MEDNSASGNPTHPVTEMAEKTSENSERTRHLPSAPEPVFHRFWELPKEIRIMIYDFAFSADWGIKLVGGIGLESEYPLQVSLRSATTVYRNIRERSRITTGLLRVNRQMYHEAVEQLYRSGNTMIIPFNHLDALLKFARKPTGFRPHQFLGPPSFPFLERACIHSRELDTRSWYTAYDRKGVAIYAVGQLGDSDHNDEAQTGRGNPYQTSRAERGSWTTGEVERHSEMDSPVRHHGGRILHYQGLAVPALQSDFFC